MKINYADYIKSPGWASKRRGKLFDANYKCEKCGSETQTLEVHHLTYERLGDERMSDLIVLCSYCHKVAHNGEPVLSPDWWKS
jgi:5-methylcytosine-specific restriction endonuclease McrA